MAREWNDQLALYENTYLDGREITDMNFELLMRGLCYRNIEPRLKDNDYYYIYLTKIQQLEEDLAKLANTADNESTIRAKQESIVSLTKRFNEERAREAENRVIVPIIKRWLEMYGIGVTKEAQSVLAGLTREEKNRVYSIVNYIGKKHIYRDELVNVARFCLNKSEKLAHYNKKISKDDIAAELFMKTFQIVSSEKISEFDGLGVLTDEWFNGYEFDSRDVEINFALGEHMYDVTELYDDDYDQMSVCTINKQFDKSLDECIANYAKAHGIKSTYIARKQIIANVTDLEYDKTYNYPVGQKDDIERGKTIARELGELDAADLIK